MSQEADIKLAEQDLNGAWSLVAMNTTFGDDVQPVQNPVGDLAPMERQFEMSADAQQLTITGPGKRPDSQIAILWARVVQPTTVASAEAENLQPIGFRARQMIGRACQPGMLLP